MKPMILNKSRGLTLTELLAVLLILSLLTTIAVPVFVARQEDARIRVALTECRQLAQAEDTVAVMHGFYVPFQLLDELPARSENLTAREERIDRYPAGLSTLFLINATVRAEDQDGVGLQPELRDGYPGGNSNARVRAMVDNWAGPFITFQRFWYNMDSAAPYDGPADPNYRDSNDMFRDFPLDPWGNPYRFYSPIGIIGNGNDHNPDTFNYENPNPQFSNGELTINDDERFQRYAVVSYGRDGVPDTHPGLPFNFIPNDIYYEFGTDGLSQNFGRF